MSEFEYERQAMNGEEMPDGLHFPDQILYLELRMLYHQYKNGIIDRDTASKEKRKLMQTNEMYKIHDKIGGDWVKIMQQTEAARAACRKNPCPENAMILINAIEGRMLEKWKD